MKIAYNVTLAICCLFSCLLIAASVGSEAAKDLPPVSEETDTCIECHTTYSPGIVEDWLKSRHAAVTPEDAARKPEAERRISANTFPDSIASVAVGCYECHGLNADAQLEGGEVEVQAAFPAGVIGTTAENLEAAAGGEHYEWAEMYPGFAEVARAEGFNAIAKIFEAIAVAEKQHEKRYLGLLANVEAGTVFKKDKPVVWRCLNCGYLHEGEEAPKVCPACAHLQEHFELLCENW